MKMFRRMAMAAVSLVAIGLAGCGGSGSSPAATANTVTVNGSLEPGAAKATLKTVNAVPVAIGTVTAIDAASGAVLSKAPVDIIADTSGTGGSFSGLALVLPPTQAGVVLKAVLNNGKTYRLLLTDTLAANTTLTGKTIGPNSDVIVAQVSGTLAHGGLLGDGGVVHSGTTLATVASTVSAVTTTVLPKLGLGYVINTGGSAIKVPGFSIIDRKTGTVVKSIRFTDGTPSVGHFANVTADGSELWLCSNKADGSAGDVNVLNTAVFDSYSTINAGNRSSIIKKSFTVGCGVQSTQTPDGRYLFTSSNQGAKGINVFDVKNRAFLGTIANSTTAPHVGAVSADGKKFYTTTAALHTAVGYDISGLPARVPTDADKILNFELGYGSLHAVRLHPNGRYLFVGNNTWPVPAGVAAVTSGVNVIELATNRIIATIPGRPHNFAISPDGRYLLSTELSSPDCEVSLPGDPGNRLQFIDISTLLTANPDPAKIRDIYHFDTPGYGGSHAAWDATTGLLYYSVYDTNSQGWLFLLNTANLAAVTPSVTQVGDKVKIGWGPHGVSFPGINGD
jgi:hypothetical protein